MQSRGKKFLTRAFLILSGSALAIAAGLLCFGYSFAEPLTRLSYDLPFLWRASLQTHDIVLIYLDEDSAKQLRQPLDDVWNRALHTQLLDRLFKEKARLVFYDVVFDAPVAEGATDEAFAESIRRHGQVILGAALEIVQPMGGIRQERVLPPIKLLRKAAAGWGLLAFKPIDSDYGVRQLFAGTGEVPSATWKTAEILGAKAAQHPGEASRRWINYYGPPETFSSVNFAQALSPDGVPPNFFSNRIVMIGGRSAVTYLGIGRDQFATPYSRSRHQFSTGLEVHSTILLNLLRGEWLTRMSLPWERTLLLAIGLLAGGLAAVRPFFAVGSTIAVSGAIAASACALVWNQRVWLDWAVPALVQMPLALAWSVGAQYLLEARRRKKLRDAFAFYLSSHMADKIANSDFDLKPGGKMVEATIMFTDLENFTTLSEGLTPEEVSRTLIAYFEQTTQCILRYNGTIVDYFGDAVMAGWGAPLDDPAHAIHAVEAACDLRGLTELEIHGQKLRTRVGLNTGQVLAGNLGSSYRFDYTMIGDTTNFASRLESLNKRLGTQVLISDAVKKHLDEKFVTRRLGEFRLAGKRRGVLIYELICRGDDQSEETDWIEEFEEGLKAFRDAEFEQARILMNRARKARGGSDGPTEFYLQKIEELHKDGQLEDNWTGVITFSEK